jgi:hypothetical protein
MWYGTGTFLASNLLLPVDMVRFRLTGAPLVCARGQLRKRLAMYEPPDEGEDIGDADA